MAIDRVRCPVAHAIVSRITDLEGATMRVICPEYQEPAGICRLKKTALDGGPLSQLLERAEDDMLGARTTRCNLR
jgi:hypothetical protein